MTVIYCSLLSQRTTTLVTTNALAISNAVTLTVFPRLLDVPAAGARPVITPRVNASRRVLSGS